MQRNLWTISFAYLPKGICCDCRMHCMYSIVPGSMNEKISESIKQEPFLPLSFTSALQTYRLPLEAKSNPSIQVSTLPDS